MSKLQTENTEKTETVLRDSATRINCPYCNYSANFFRKHSVTGERIYGHALLDLHIGLYHKTELSHGDKD